MFELECVNVGAHAVASQAIRDDGQGWAEENVGRLSRWRCCVVDDTLDVRQGVIWTSEEEVAPACTVLMNAAGE